MFAAGCIISELRLGRPVFPSNSAKGNLHYLIQMRAFLGPLPDTIARQAVVKKPGYFRLIRVNGNDMPKLDWRKFMTRTEMEQRVERAADMKVSSRSELIVWAIFN